LGLFWKEQLKKQTVFYTTQWKRTAAA